MVNANAKETSPRSLSTFQLSAIHVGQQKAPHSGVFLLVYSRGRESSWKHPVNVSSNLYTEVPPAHAPRGRGSESFRVGQQKAPHSGVFLLAYSRGREASWKHHVNLPINPYTGVLPAHAPRGRGSESFRVGHTSLICTFFRGYGSVRSFFSKTDRHSARIVLRACFR